MNQDEIEQSSAAQAPQKNSDLGDISQVIPDNKWSAQSWVIWGTIGIIATLLIVNWAFHPTRVHPKDEISNAERDYQTELASNLAAIKKMQEDTKAQLLQVAEKRPNELVEKSQQSEMSQEDIIEKRLFLERERQKQLEQDEVYKMRVHAPTSLMGTDSARSTSVASMQEVSKGGSGVVAGGGANQNFINQATGVETVSATKIAHPDFTVASGELIQAVLETPINSDLPGMIRAITSQPVYAYTGDMAIIPAGSRLIGQYSSGVVQGQSRVLVVWNRVILPNGTSAQINSPGTDNQGVSGQGADSINRHFFARFGEASLLSIIGAGTATVGVSSNSEYNSSAAYRMAVAQSFSDAANETLDNAVSIQPTLVVHQGAQINVFVARDLDFSSAMRSS